MNTFFNKLKKILNSIFSLGPLSFMFCTAVAGWLWLIVPHGTGYSPFLFNFAALIIIVIGGAFWYSRRKGVDYFEDLKNKNK